MNSQARNHHLDMLRGISILLVCLGHSVLPTQSLSPLIAPFFDAAFGVRMFFVLSGFIITSLLIHEKRSSGFIDWKAFLIKRFSKLLPGLVILILFIQAFQTYWMGTCKLRDSFISLFFLSEVVGIGCWELAHTWSLSVEELFYVSWIPCVILLSRNQLIKILVGVCFLAPLVRTYNHLTNSHPEWFAPQLIISIPWISHLDLIAFGSLGAFFWDRARYKKSSFSSSPAKHRLLCSLLSVLLFCSALPFSEIPFLKALDYLAIPFRSTFQGFLLVALIGGLISQPRKRTGLFKRTLAYLGTISYSLYLFQQVIIPNRFAESTKISWSIEGASYYFLLAIGLGAMNYHLVEIPCLRYLRRKWNVAPSKLIWS